MHESSFAILIPFAMRNKPPPTTNGHKLFQHRPAAPMQLKKKIAHGFALRLFISLIVLFTGVFIQVFLAGAKVYVLFVALDDMNDHRIFWLAGSAVAKYPPPVESRHVLQNAICNMRYAVHPGRLFSAGGGRQDSDL